MNRTADRGDIVPVPLPSDGVGNALRATYQAGPALPTEWCLLLANIDQRR